MAPKIITLTVNPALDKSTSVAGLVAHKKLRCTDPVYEAGGGGINISKVLQSLGQTSHCLFLGGGAAAAQLKELLEAAGIDHKMLPIAGRTRENLAVLDTATQLQYRFGMPGPKVTDGECSAVLDILAKLLEAGTYLVASGSLSPGMPLDFFRQVGKLAREKGSFFFLDTSGIALKEGVREGVYLLKPNLGELATLCGLESISAEALVPTGRTFLRDHPCDILVVSLGAKGALLLTDTIAELIPAPVVAQQSTIGAGDSMVAGMVHGLSKGMSVRDMARFGVACGTAATMTPGSQLCRPEDAEQLFAWLRAQPINPSQYPQSA